MSGTALDDDVDIVPDARVQRIARALAVRSQRTRHEVRTVSWWATIFRKRRRASRVP